MKRFCIIKLKKGKIKMETKNKIFSFQFKLLTFFLFQIIFLISKFTSAQEQIKPYMLIIFDTSGSMAWDVPGNDTQGDGTRDPWGSRWCCPGIDRNGNGQTDDSRMYQSKTAIYRVVSSTGDITFGLMKFPQYFVPGHRVMDWYYGNQAAGAYDYLRYDGECTSATLTDYLVVQFSNESSNNVLMWIDNREYSAAWTPISANERELRADGPTPLGWTVQQARIYFANTVIPGDSKRDCRPYYAVVLSDGEETCGGNPPIAVRDLYSITYSGRTYHVKTTVIGYATSNTTLNQMADYGDDGLANGSTSAYRADSTDQLAAIFSDIVQRSILIEVCNQRDDDCDCPGDTNGDTVVCGPGDTGVDEGFTLYCNRPGGQPRQILCNDPGETVCDGIDDNCNGQIDEGLLNRCGRCGAEPQEICDGLDNDCDGFIDEDNVCGGCIPQPEICNGRDDDCDGRIDEGITRTCGTDVGECTVGTQNCVEGGSGTWTPCTGIGPQPEQCDGLDNNCNGITDELSRQCEMAPGVGDTGECTYGYQVCIAPNTWSECQGGIGPRPEVCDGLDNDCDGVVDNGNPGGGAPCGTDTGECRSGIMTCTGGRLICTGGQGPVPEICDGLDNDCDGVLDNGNPGGGDICGPTDKCDIGICECGRITCITHGPGSASLECIGAVYPDVEDCNNLDDDCNGLVDDNLPSGTPCGTDVGECTPGVLECVGGTWVCNGSTGPSDEICDGLDNDCDGSTDEGNPQGGGLCGSSTGECSQGIAWCSDTDTPPPCTPDEPLDPPRLLCLCELGPTPEICDGLDNDCNGLIDDGLGLGDECWIDPNATQGDCTPGRYQCVDGETICAGGTGPQPEVCDCSDNNCNGLIDEDNPCAEPEVCLHESDTNCYCTKLCDPQREFPCPAGEVCDFCPELGMGDNVTCCKGNPCWDVACDECQKCIDGDCVDICTGVTCDEGQVCICLNNQASCVVANCYVDLPEYRCPEGEVCVNGQCVSDPCAGIECDPQTQFCRDGECRNVCSVETIGSCPECYYCYDGECVQDLCCKITCAEGNVCNPQTGQCEEDKCKGVDCPWPQECVNGECRDEPCYHINCPEGYYCVDGTCYEEGAIPDETIPDSSAEEKEEGEEGDTGGAGQKIMTTGGGGCAGCTIAGSENHKENANGVIFIICTMLVIACLRLKNRKEFFVLMVFLFVFAAISFSGCHKVPYCIGNCESDAQNADGDENIVPPDGFDAEFEISIDSIDIGQDGEIPEGIDQPSENPDITIDGCIPCENTYPSCYEGKTCCTPDGKETCNNIDDDCDGQIDEDEDIHFQTNPRHCGQCNHSCALPHAETECVNGECVFIRCQSYFADCIPDDPMNPESPGCETYCIKTQEDDSICDRIDNDCDCQVDEDVSLTTDIQNCGSCGTRCRFPHATAECYSPDGTPEHAYCRIASCDEGYYDIDPTQPGCEYSCRRCEYTEPDCILGHTCCTLSGDETCNGLDNDCDGIVDDGNPEGGGACGSSTGDCQQGTLTCVNGEIVCQGGVLPQDERCDGRDNDCDGDTDEPGSGEFLPDENQPCGETSTGDCELGRTRCIGGTLQCEGYIGPQSEVCDGRDNDCDGSVDELPLPGVGDACGSSVGNCSQGQIACVSGALVCQGDVGPSPEICDGQDNDCNNIIDDPFNLNVDPNNCGACGRRCADIVGPHTIYVCSSGNCRVIGCEDGYWDIDSNPLTCEYACSYSGDEVCDGIDNDCDGLVDTADSSLSIPSNFCNQIGECRGSSPVCTTHNGITKWYCNYGPTVNLDTDFETILPENDCDGLDDDCDGVADDAFPLKGTPCSVGQGLCRRTGQYVCNSRQDGIECNVTAGTPQPESCNGVDDDCDTIVDNFSETAWDVIGAQAVSGSGAQRVFRYEASRPDAGACSTGTQSGTGTSLTTKPCSRAGVQPWASVDWVTAREACCNLNDDGQCHYSGSGAPQRWNLCTAPVWQEICESQGQNYTYPYGNTYQPNYCNGNDYDTNCPCPGPSCSDTTGDQDEILATGSLPNCCSNWGGTCIYDMSGNVKEWTYTQRMVNGVSYREIRGGANNVPSSGLTCQFNFVIGREDFLFYNLGFRCCYY